MKLRSRAPMAPKGRGGRPKSNLKWCLDYRDYVLVADGHRELGRVIPDCNCIGSWRPLFYAGDLKTFPKWPRLRCKPPRKLHWYFGARMTKVSAKEAVKAHVASLLQVQQATKQ